MPDLGRADPEGERAERAVGGSMAVAAHDRLARLRQAHFRADHVDDPAPRVVEAEQVDAMLGAVRLELVDLFLRRLGRVGQPPVRARRQGRRRVVERRLRQVGAADLETALFQHGEGLRRGDLVHQVQVDEEDRGRVLAFRDDDMRVPQLVEQGSCHCSTLRLRRPDARRPPCARGC